MKNLFWKYIQDEEGQTSTEYILLVAVVAMIVIKFRKELDSQLTSISQNVFGKMNDTVNDFDVE